MLNVYFLKWWTGLKYLFPRQVTSFSNKNSSKQWGNKIFSLPYRDNGRVRNDSRDPYLYQAKKENLLYCTESLNWPNTETKWVK